MIKLFKKDETQFTHDGVEVLDDIVISSYTSWTENSKWVIEAKFKKDFDKSEAIEEGMFLQVPTEKGLQLFRILKVSKKNKKYITVSGYQIGFDFDDNFIQDINIVEKSGRAAIKQIQGGTIYTNKFNLSSNIDTVASARMVRKNGIDALLGSDDNTFVNRWGGYLVLDNFNISMNESVGEDRGVEILVGKNVIDFEGSIDISSVITGINAITYDGLTLPEGVYYSPLVNNYPHPKIQEFKFDNIKYKYSEHGSEDGYETLEEVYEALRKECDKLFKEQNIDKPTCSLRLSIAELSKTDQYKGDELNERIYQGDILTANLEDYGFNVKLKMTANKYNNIKDRYEDIDLGDVKGNALSNINKVQNAIDKVVEQLGGNSWQDILDKSMDEATQLIEAGIKDSYVVARKNEILIMDSPQVESSINVIRMNKNGIAFSQSGYNGPYTLAITIDGKINASCITTGELNAALIKTGTIMSANGNLALNIDEDYFEVTHTEGATKTRIDEEGFYILDENNETIASLASKEAWTELKADKVFANNIENIYVGDSNLYVNHSYVGESDGSIDKPFKSFNELQSYLSLTRVINKAITIYILTTGDCSEPLLLDGFYGVGQLNISFSKGGKYQGESTHECGIKLSNIQIPVVISGESLFNKFAHGGLFYNCNFVQVSGLIFNVPNYGVMFQNTNGLVKFCDFCSSWCAVGAIKSSVVHCIANSGNAGTNGDGEAFRVLDGGTIYYGTTSGTQAIPYGIMKEQEGRIFKSGECNQSLSWNYPNSQPSPPATTMVYNQSFNSTSRATYQYKWGNWSSGECKSGVYSSYGDKAGHLFFDLTAIRNFLNSGTVVDGATITLTRANSGGTSAGVNISVGGSSCSGASGTPTYSNKGNVGTLSWGQTNTFTLPKYIVDGLKNGTINSLTTHGSNYSNIVACSINLKIKK